MTTIAPSINCPTRQLSQCGRHDLLAGLSVPVVEECSDIVWRSPEGRKLYFFDAFFSAFGLAAFFLAFFAAGFSAAFAFLLVKMLSQLSENFWVEPTRTMLMGLRAPGPPV